MRTNLRGAVDRRISRFLSAKFLQMRNSRPIVSFTFDDVPRSAATTGMRILEAAGACGTFYVAGALCGKDVDGKLCASQDEICTLTERGHEIGCHTFSHVSVAELTSQALQLDLERNAGFIRSVCGDLVLSNFAYPFGDVSPSQKRRLQSMFASCRAAGRIHRGVNVGHADLALLKSVALYSDELDRPEILKLVEYTKRHNGWLIFYTHDVEATASKHGTTAELLEFCLAQARKAECDILTIKNAIGAIAFSEAATI
jgi:peptidoglycan/xylan/chitin deacetylase (PgdA/CDA1 family)